MDQEACAVIVNIGMVQKVHVLHGSSCCGFNMPFSFLLSPSASYILTLHVHMRGSAALRMAASIPLSLEAFQTGGSQSLLFENVDRFTFHS